VNSALVAICREFETIGNFIKEPSVEKEALVNKLFFEFLDAYASIGAEKLDYPKEFQYDVRLYREGFEPLVKKFEDVQIRYLMLSDFYDYVRITKKYRP